MQYPEGQSRRQRSPPPHKLAREHGCPTPEVGVGLRQTPAVQLCPAAQSLPQAPQWAVSVLRSTQAPAHIVLGAAQALWQAPATQVSPTPQARLQPPQWAGLMLTSTQPPPQAWRRPSGYIGRRARPWRTPI